MDITPAVNLLKSLRGERVDYIILIGEGIDNAFDAGAKRVDVTINDDVVSFKDNGKGITRDRIGAIVSLGEHGHMTTTQLGRYGIGIKVQAVNAGDKLTVVSVSQDGKVMLEVDWQKVLKSGIWQIENPRWLPHAVGTSTGTILEISALRPQRRKGLDKIFESVALAFYPAIAEGRVIAINGTVAQLLPEPKMTNIVDRHISLGGDRTAHVRGGVLIGPSKLNRVHVAYEHRVIMPNSTLGCAGYTGLNRMFARVEIAGRWRLAKFKDDLPDDGERDELEEAVGELLLPILEQCNSASMSAVIDELSRDLNDMIPAELSPARPRHTKTAPPGPNPNMKRRRPPGKVAADNSDPANGPARALRPPRDQLLITFDGNSEEDGVGCFQSGRPNRVNLSKDDPDIAALIANRDREVGKRALFGFAMFIFESGRQGRQPELPYETFGRRVSDLLSLQSIEKDTAVYEA